MLRTILVYLGVNTGDMEKGMMRFEANVSVRPRGSTEFGTRVEIKNLNSFRALTRSVEYEIQRQSELLDAGGVVEQETMGWNESAGHTYPQRSKEHAHDYRYFPEPDIPPLQLDPAWIAAVQAELPELPTDRRRRLTTQYGIRPYDAELLSADRALADYFETAVRMGQELALAPQDVANWITGELFRLLNEALIPITTCRVTPEHLVTLLFLIQKGTISASAAKKVLDEVFETGEAPNTVVKHLGLAQMSDADALSALIAQVLDQNPTQLAQYLEGKESVLGWFVGQVMRASQGKANPAQTREMLQKSLEQRRSSQS
jgi:aspartyl-tRNA(Asn)/glutamyl-tRNA(Gln) amidotransferase subunit B